MNNQTLLLDALRRAAEELELEVQSYSGRAMYGKRCAGINVSHATNEYEVITDLICTMLENIAIDQEARDEADDDIDSLNDPEAVRKLFSSTKSDSLGLGTILYWPRLEWVEPPADEEVDVEDAILESEDQ